MQITIYISERKSFNMIYKFSETAKNAIESAEQIAISLGHNYVGSEHILFGIANQIDCMAYKILKNQNIKAQDIFHISR